MSGQRKQAEIVARIENIAKDDYFGFRREVLLRALDFDHAKPYLKEGTTADQWGAPTDTGEEAKEYYGFALGKIRDHRGLSADRSVQKLTEYAWLLGRDDVVAAMDAADYPQYGAPKVKAFADLMGYEWPDDKELTNMARGDYCRPLCDMGCGS